MKNQADEGAPKPSETTSPKGSNEEWKVESALRPVKNVSLKMLPDKAPSRDELILQQEDSLDAKGIENTSQL